MRKIKENVENIRAMGCRVSRHLNNFSEKCSFYNMEPLHTLFMSAGPEVGPRNASFSPRRLSYFPLPINSFTSIIIYQKKKKKKSTQSILA